MDLKLNGRKALITGGSKGIGFASALALAKEGVDVALTARDQKTLDEAAAKIRAQANVGVQSLAADLATREGVASAIDRFGDIDILVNNAGSIPGGNILEIDGDRWRQAWDLKVFGYIDMCRGFVEKMTGRGKGVIINILGLAGEKLDHKYIAGTAGNASLMALTRALGAGCIDKGVRVVGINPGPVATDRLVTLMKKRATDALGDAERWPELTRQMPLGRPAHPEEIAPAVCFLASDVSSYTSGVILTIDGGIAFRG
jgi:NAD(P)-dependent dehydrogenase (short-subunit alcohol dehydrogenase family)